MKTLFQFPEKPDTLTSEEMLEITNSHRREGQIKWLSENGYIYEVYADGWPRVHRYYQLCRMLGLKPQDFMTGIKAWTPDFSKLND